MAAPVPTASLVLGVAAANRAREREVRGHRGAGGGANVSPGAMRVMFWGALAMALTAGVGALFGTVA